VCDDKKNRIMHVCENLLKFLKGFSHFNQKWVIYIKEQKSQYLFKGYFASTNF